MNVSEAEIAEIRPDFIILDEFHRCGAELWGEGVKSVLVENLTEEEIAKMRKSAEALKTVIASITF